MPKKAKWNEIPCPQCKEPVAWNATRCPRCQAAYSAAQIETRKRSHELTQKWGFGCAAILGILLLGMCALGGGDNQTTADSSVTNESSVVPAAGSASAAVTAAVEKLHDEIMAGVADCDAAGKALAARADGLTTGATSMYDGYRLAAQVEHACRNSWREVSRIEVPSELTGAARARAEEALETCENAMIAKQMSGEAMKEVFDGNMRPSKVEDARQKAEASQAGTWACVAGIFDTGMKAGVDVSKLGDQQR